MLIDFLNEFSDAQVVTATAVGSKTVNGVIASEAKLSELYLHILRTTEVSQIGTLTMATQPTAGDTITIGDTVYTFVADGTADEAGEIDVGADVADAKTLVVGAVNGTGLSFNVANGQVVATAFAGDDMVVTAVAGLAGDLIATTETFDDATDAWAAINLGTGTVTFALETSATASASALSGTVVTLLTSGAISIADINANAEALNVRLPVGALKYLGIRYTVSSALITGAFDAFLNADAN